MKKIVKNDLFDYSGRFIYQSPEFFRFSLDSILLAEFVDLKKGSVNILDLCTGNAPVPLILTKYSKAKIYGFEIQKEIYDLAKKSIICNNLSEQISIFNDDINNIYAYFEKNCFDVITCNPPYFKYINNEKGINNNEILAIARHEIKLNLEDIFKIVKDYLKDNGSFYMVHRPDRLDEIIILGNKYGINVKKVQLIVTKNRDKPELVLVKCQKHCKLGLKMCPVIDITNLKTYQCIFKEKK